MQDLYREIQIDRLLECFSAMGGTKEDLKKERTKLKQDDPYLESWLETVNMKPEGWLKSLVRVTRIKIFKH